MWLGIYAPSTALCLGFYVYLRMVLCPALSNVIGGQGNGLIDLLGLHLVCKSETMKGHFSLLWGLPPTVCNLGILPGGKKTDLEEDSTQEHSPLPHTDPQRIPPPSPFFFFFLFLKPKFEAKSTVGSRRHFKLHSLRSLNGKTWQVC